MSNQVGILFGFKIFFLNQAVINVHSKILISTRYYTADQLVSFDIFLAQRRPIYQKWSTKRPDIIFPRTNVTKAR